MQKCSLLQLCPLLQLCQLCFIVSVVHKKKTRQHADRCVICTHVVKSHSSTTCLHRLVHNQQTNPLHHFQTTEWTENGRTMVAHWPQHKSNVKKRTTHHKQHHENGRRMAAEWSQMVATKKLETNTNTNRTKTTEPTICGFRTKAT